MGITCSSKDGKGEKGKVGSRKVESPDKLQEKLIKEVKGKGNVLWVESPRKLRGRLWDSLPKCH
jgi:hypothetical protein